MGEKKTTKKNLIATLLMHVRFDPLPFRPVLTHLTYSIQTYIRLLQTTNSTLVELLKCFAKYWTMFVMTWRTMKLDQDLLLNQGQYDL